MFGKIPINANGYKYLSVVSFYRSSHPKCSVRESFIRNFANSQENT